MDPWRTEFEQAGFIELTLPTSAAQQLRHDVVAIGQPIMVTLDTGHVVELAGVMLRWAHTSGDHTRVRLEGTLRPPPTGTLG